MKIRTLLMIVLLALPAAAQLQNHTRPYQAPYLESINSGGATGAGAPYFNAARQLNELNRQMMERNRAAQDSYNQGYGGGYTPMYIPPPTPAQLAAQQRAAEAAARQQQQQMLQQQRAAEQAAREQARAQAEAQRQWAKDEGIATGYLNAAKLTAAQRAEARIIAMEQQDEWRKASNAIWNSKSKDPWADYSKKLDDWDNSLAALSEKVQKTPPSQSNQPILLRDGTTSTLKERARISDYEYMNNVLKSPNAKKMNGQGASPSQSNKEGDNEWLKTIKSPKADYTTKPKVSPEMEALFPLNDKKAPAKR